MNPRISKLFEKVDHLEKEVDCCLINGQIYRAIYLKEQIQIRKNYIEDIRGVLRNNIPEPWASMSADEITKGLGVYI